MHITKTLTGAYIVHYGCAKCKESLRSDLKEAGQQDKCPSCGSVFIVPGGEQLAELQQKEQQKNEEAAEDNRQRQLERKRREAENELSREIESQIQQHETEIGIADADATDQHLAYRDRNDWVSFCVRIARRWLNFLLIGYSISAALTVAVMLVAALVRILFAVKAGTSVLPVVLTTSIVILGTVVSWFAMVLGIGLAGTLFKIEENTRAMRAKVKRPADGS